MKMLEIEIDEDVYSAIERNAVGLNKKPNDVLRKLFNLDPNGEKVIASKSQVTGKSLDSFLQSDEYLKKSTADDKYLNLIGWLLRNHPKLKESLNNYSLRTRILFSKDSKAIENSAQGGVIKLIPHENLFAMVTLDNRSKRKIVGKVLLMAGYDNSQIERVLNTLPGSASRHGNIFLQLLKQP